MKKAMSRASEKTTICPEAIEKMSKLYPNGEWQKSRVQAQLGNSMPRANGESEKIVSPGGVGKMLSRANGENRMPRGNLENKNMLAPGRMGKMLSRTGGEIVYPEAIKKMRQFYALHDGGWET